MWKNNMEEKQTQMKGGEFILYTSIWCTVIRIFKSLDETRQNMRFHVGASHHHDTTATTVSRMAHRFDKEPSMKIRSKVDGGNLSLVNAQQRSKPSAGIPFHWLVHWDPSMGASQSRYNGYNHRLYTANNQGHRSSWCTFLSCPHSSWIAYSKFVAKDFYYKPATSQFDNQDD